MNKMVCLIAGVSMVAVGAGVAFTINNTNAVYDGVSIVENTDFKVKGDEIVAYTIPKETTVTTTTATNRTTTTTVSSTTTSTTTTTTQPKQVMAENLTARPTSVASVEVIWESKETDREYSVSVTDTSNEAEYFENITYLLGENKCDITGLRENTEYEIVVTPVAKESDENIILREMTVKVKTETVEVIEEYPFEEGWTNCFAGERASGLTLNPSYSAIYGSQVDSITGTGIRRFENGDYCCAMGLFYGMCNDRFLIELDNGIQFTVRICDSKGWADDADANGYIGDEIDRDLDGDGVKDADGDGVPDGRFHWFGGAGNGKCIVEFIYDDYNLPSCVSYYGTWGKWNWNGLNLGANIKSIKKINYESES